jgi:hypothetical protein
VAQDNNIKRHFAGNLLYRKLDVKDERACFVLFLGPFGMRFGGEKIFAKPSIIFLTFENIVFIINFAIFWRWHGGIL